MKLTFNKQNWSGEEASINVNQKDKAWSQSGYRFHLVEDVKQRLTFDDGDTCTVYHIHGDSWSAPLGTVCTTDSGKKWRAADDYEGACERYANNEFIAASQLLFNIV